MNCKLCELAKNNPSRHQLSILAPSVRKVRHSSDNNNPVIIYWIWVVVLPWLTPTIEDKFTSQITKAVVYKNPPQK